jgi:hypothetical protein
MLLWVCLQTVAFPLQEAQSRVLQLGLLLLLLSLHMLCC